MTVYVDNMRAKFGRMRMSHMMADTSEELHAMAKKIGVARRHCQYPETYKEHYDVAAVKRALAIRLGAKEVTTLELGRVLIRKRQEMRRGIEEGRTKESQQLPQQSGSERAGVRAQGQRRDRASDCETMGVRISREQR